MAVQCPLIACALTCAVSSEGEKSVAGRSAYLRICCVLYVLSTKTTESPYYYMDRRCSK